MLFQLAASPAAMLALFIFFKDKYEKEPYFMLVTCGLFGFISCGYVLALDLAIEHIPIKQGSLFSVFVLSAGTEELIKLIFVFFLNFKNKQLNEPFDAVIYSSYVCLGFAWAENIIYVFSPELGGLETAFMRAVFSVPGRKKGTQRVPFGFPSSEPISGRSPSSWQSTRCSTRDDPHGA